MISITEAFIAKQDGQYNFNFFPLFEASLKSRNEISIWEVENYSAMIDNLERFKEQQSKWTNLAPGAPELMTQWNYFRKVLICSAGLFDHAIEERPCDSTLKI